MTIFTLLILFQIKHYLADFPLQTPYMLGKFKDTGWIKPLAAHCAVHALFTLNISLLFGASVFVAYYLALLDFIIHFCMDRIKASPKMLGRFKSLSHYDFYGWIKECNDETKDSLLRDNKYFWWALGFDQFVHHLTHYLIIWILIK